MTDYTELVKRILKDKKAMAQSSSDISNYKKWYQGTPTSWHKYSIWNGEKEIRRTRLSMKMAKQCCEDWASLLMNEKVKIGVKSQDLLDKKLIETNFYNKANKSVEYSFGLSMAALTVELENLKFDLEPTDEEGKYIANLLPDQNTKVGIGVYSLLKIVPITFENDEVTECAFIKVNTKDTQIIIHLIDDVTKEYKIVIAKVNNETQSVGDVVEFPTGSKKPFFVIVHPQLVNNIDLDSPYPIPVFANAIDTLKAIDAKYDSYVNEFILGRKRIFVSKDMNKVDSKTGEVVNDFDPNDIVYQILPKDMGMINGGDKNLIVVSNDALRAAEHSQAVQDELNFFSKQVGLGVDYYRFEKGRVMTATQVISEKSDTFRNLKKHEGVFEKALITIISSYMYAHNEYTTNEEKFADIDVVEIQFDDSIIEDKNTEKDADKKDIDLGAMSLVAYRMKWFAESEEDAKEKVKAIYGDAEFLKRLQNYSPFLTQGVITPLDFVKNVYLDIKTEEEQNELAETIKEQIKSSNSIVPEDIAGNIYNPQE